MSAICEIGPTDVPLHGGKMFDPWYWACKQPERPDDNYTRYDFRCEGCLLAGEMVIRTNPERADRTAPAKVSHGPNQGLNVEISLRDLVTRAREWQVSLSR